MKQLSFRELMAIYWQDLRDAIFPRDCPVCGRSLIDGEEFMCMHCDTALPRTDFHRVESNPVEERLVGRVPIQRATSWFRYKRSSPYVALVHDAKYRGGKRLAIALGAKAARELMPEGFFDSVDVLMPVPMHWRKERKRGYNQAEMIARGISRVTSIPIADNLRAPRSHSTQTRRSAYERYENVRGLFEVIEPAELAGCHILLVDDVLTTGSTILACSEALAAAIPGVRISVMTLAVASLL